MKSIYKLFSILMVLVLFNCEQDNNPDLSNFVGFEIGPKNYAVDRDATKTVDITVASSDTSGSDRTYNIVVDEDASDLEAAYTVPSTVTIPANSNVGTLTVSVTDNESLSFVPQKLVLDFQDEVGLSFGNPIKLTFVENCLDTLVTLTILFDDYPDETSWEIYDLSGAPVVIYSGGPFTSADAGATFKKDFCLPSGNYGVVVYDSYGDGIASDGYTVTAGDVTLASGQVISAVNQATFTVD